ncbi:MAG: cupin domain-containing protein [Candidatus Sericytochromatia bacterium]|nr:cupin domain-containing protein [Candidatus Sericytochromatia bacterium]
MNADYALKVVLQHSDLPWAQGPEARIERRFLEKGGEGGSRATAILRGHPGAHWVSLAGEEIFVLDGAISDENREYPAGTYLMFPPGMRAPLFTVAGCTLFTKCGHLISDVMQRECIDTHHAPWYQGLVPGLNVMPLMRQGTGSTLVRWAPKTYFDAHRHFGGEEIFVVSGIFSDEHGHYPEGTWIRSPHMSQHTPFSVEGCTIFVKTGHLLAGQEHSPFGV